ncbi:transcription factor HHO2-like [Wolffia australiana]
MDLPLIFSKAEKKGKSYVEYLSALEEERKKIQVFQRELPFSLHLVTYAIESCRRQIAAELFPPSSSNVRSENVEEEPLSDGAPALEEFLPIKLNSISADIENEESGDTTTKKQNWLKSAQLWTSYSNEQDNRDSLVSVAGKEKKSTTTFLSFLPPTELETSTASEDVLTAPSSTIPPQTASSTSETRGVIGSSSSGSDDRRTMAHRKSRRCWSQDLHRRFLDALNQLGGTEAATPKRIREIMKEDGLTNDEVKSHLQKYRLHSRRPCQTTHGKGSSAQQVVFVGGMWMPSSRYAASTMQH